MKSKEKVVAEIIKAQNGKAVTVVFRKRSDGEIRTLNGRLGVVQKLKGGELRYDPADYKLLTIYDLQKHDYRSIPLDAVKSVKADGIVYKFPKVVKK